MPSRDFTYRLIAHDAGRERMLQRISNDARWHHYQSDGRHVWVDGKRIRPLLARIRGWRR